MLEAGSKVGRAVDMVQTGIKEGAEVGILRGCSFLKGAQLILYCSVNTHGESRGYEISVKLHCNVTIVHLSSRQLEMIWGLMSSQLCWLRFDLNILLSSRQFNEVISLIRTIFSRYLFSII